MPRSAMTDGPKTMAPSPVPVGCEQDPVTEGIFKAESTKAKAPEAASVIRASGRSATIWRMRRAPITTKGAEAIYQPRHWAAGR